MATQNPAEEEPEFISFLFSSKLEHDCFFLVGSQTPMVAERIGVVKAMLMAHSVVLRLELEDSKLADKREVPVPDVYPDTFRILLRYVYGNDTTAALCFYEADSLLFIAEKFKMSTLKKKLATRLMSLLNTENICSLLNNPVCYTQLELNSAITEILRCETDSVLASPLFLGLTPTGFIKILEQDASNVPEIELGRAMIKWAKHNADSEDGEALWTQISKLTKHVRVCTLNSDQFRHEMVPSEVLTKDEVALVCMSIRRQEKLERLTEICNEIKPRSLPQKKEKPAESVKKPFELKFTNHNRIFHSATEFNFVVITNKSDIELLPLECPAVRRPKNKKIALDAMLDVSCTTTITRITDHQDNTSTETPITVRFNQQVEYGTTFMIPLTSGGHNVTLRAYNRYTFRMVFGGYQPLYVDWPEAHRYFNDHLTLLIRPCETLEDEYRHRVPMNALKYKAMDA